MKKSFRKGLEYFPVDVDIFSDEKIISLMDTKGAYSVAVLFAILAAIYRDGYYMVWNDLSRGKIAFQIRSVSLENIDIYVNTLVKIGFFDKEAFNKHSVLTSASIQERYFAFVSPANPDDLPFLLIELPKKPRKSKSNPDAAELAPAESSSPAASLSSAPQPAASSASQVSNDSRVRVTGYRPSAPTVTMSKSPARHPYPASARAPYAASAPASYAASARALYPATHGLRPTPRTANQPPFPAVVPPGRPDGSPSFAQALYTF